MTVEPKPVEGSYVYMDGKKCHEKVYEWLSVSAYEGKESVQSYYATINNVKVKPA